MDVALVLHLLLAGSAFQIRFLPFVREKNKPHMTEPELLRLPGRSSGECKGGGGVESMVELVLAVCYTLSGGFGVWFSCFT